MFTPLTKVPVAQLLQDFFTPLHNFDIDVDTSKQGNETKNEHSIFTPQHNTDRSEEELMIFTPMCNFDAGSNSVVRKGFANENDFESSLVCDDESTLKEETSNIICDITNNNVGICLFASPHEGNEGPQTCFTKKVSTISNLQNVKDVKKSDVDDNELGTLMNNYDSLLESVNQDTTDIFETMFSEKNIYDKVVTSSVAQTVGDVENVQSREKICISPLNLSLEEVDEFIKEVMLKTTSPGKIYANC